MSGCNVPVSYFAIVLCAIPVSFATSVCVNPVFILAFLFCLESFPNTFLSLLFNSKVA